MKKVRDWAESYRKHAANITLRFFVGHAISFAYTLQNKRATGAATAKWYQHVDGFQPLVLDGSDYHSPPTAPLTFDVIDTSNLVDHLGGLVLLTAAAPLLRHSLSATLSTEVLGRPTKQNVVLTRMLCGDMPTISTVLGLFPVSYWTDTLSREAETSMKLHLRTRWKRAMNGRSIPRNCGPLGIQIPNGDLVELLRKVFNCMFWQEDIARIEACAMGRYSRASFAAFLGLVRSRIICDWDALMRSLINRIVRPTGATSNMSLLQELLTFLRMWNLHDNASYMHLDTHRHLPPLNPKRGDLGDWQDIPDTVCITLRVPRKQLSVLTGLDTRAVSVRCSLQAGTQSWHHIFPWYHIFSACQLGFGTVSTTGAIHTNTFAVSVTGDYLGWKGKSDLIVSFFVSATVALRDPGKEIVSFALMTPPLSREIGPTLKIVYQTTVSDTSHVYITKYAPGQSGLPVIPGFNRPKKMTLLVGHAGHDTGALDSFIAHLGLASKGHQETLRYAGEGLTSATTPSLEVSLGTQSGLQGFFPGFILFEQIQVSICQVSFCVTIVAPMADCRSGRTQDVNFMYPTILQQLANDKVRSLSWNLPYLNMDMCPVVDIDKICEIGWLRKHVFWSAMSARERTLWIDPSSPRLLAEQARIDFKKSFSSIMMHYTGMQGERKKVFGLSTPNSEISIILIPSAVRIDLFHGTVTLDCAVLQTHVAEFVATATSEGLCSMELSVRGMELWRNTLPAFVERCRSWHHHDGCEYAAKNARVPRGPCLLCSCGNGQFPAGFVDHHQLPWDSASLCAVRAAISPAFCAPFAYPS